MAIAIRSLALLAVGIGFLASTAFAQVPKIGRPYVDKSDLGFHVKVPADWDLIPPQPGEPNLVAKYDPPQIKYVLAGTDPIWLHCWIVKFDRRPEPEAAKTKDGPKIEQKAAKDLNAWLKSELTLKLTLASEKPFMADKIEAVEYQYTSPGDPKLSTRIYAAVYKLKPDVDVALIFSAPGDPKKWNKWEGPFDQMSRSFGAEEVKAAAAPLPGGGTLRERKKAELEKSLATLPGWKLYETPHYFLVTPHTDRGFVAELQQRLEAIHAIYEEDYPAAKAEELRKAGAGAKTGEETEEEKAAKAVEDELFNDGATPQEMSTCSVVRVFTDQSAYHSYGGPGGSAGYWSPYHRELVLYDDQAGGGRNDTWIVLNHEAFHQYIFYFYGNISPHSWYNEGTGDFYSGYIWKNGKFTLKENSWRKTTISMAVREGAGSFCPLDKFVRWSQREYYGSNDLGLGGGENYAQGWSLIYFLRTGKKNNAKGWDPAWDSILDTYLRVLATSGKLDQAVEEAFKGVDMKALEDAWIAYTR